MHAPAARPCTGAILAGGAASRLDGRPKGLELVGGRRILHRVAGALAQVSDDLLLVANAPDAAAWLPGTPVVRDTVRDAGPLGGLQAALAHAPGAVLAVAWDMPFVSPSLLGELRRRGERGGADAVVPESAPDGALEPLCAYYASSSLAIVDVVLAEGERRLGALLARLRVERVPHARVVDWGDPRRLFFNVNTPTALREARRLACPTDA
ncbi:MAG TPA: molybdenum cofactor guanylyltransferase [Gemmatimonadaceae bacterium]|nr:molybdenum cofactor guanylyltransferase [Gemmatimonadaceae bacterium]